MAGRQLELLISLKGKLEKSLPESVRRAAAVAGELQKKLNHLNEIKVKADKYKALEQATRSLGENLTQARNKAVQLEAEFRKNQAAAAQYKAQINQMRTALEGMSRSANPEAYKAARASLAQLTAAHKSAQAAAKASERAFKEASAGVSASDAKYRRNREALRELGAELQRSGFYTQFFASNQRHLQQELQRTEQALAQAQRVQQQYNNQQQQQRQLTHGEAQQDFYNATGNWQAGLEVSKSILSPFADAVSVAMDFEAEMAKVKSLTQMDNIKLGNWDKVNAEMQKLTEQASEMGRTTQFTAVQAAQAQTELARAGYDTEKIYASLPHVLNMAAVENMALGDAARIATNIMSGFGLGADQIEHSIDVLAYTSTHANTDLTNLGETMKYAAPVARSFGASLEETATMAKFMADAGIVGSQAGTSLRQGLLRLVAPPKKASKAMEEMGVTVSDAQAEWENANAVAQAYGVTLDSTKGPGEQLISIIEQIEKGMAGASEQEKLAALSAITGINAVSGWASVLNNSSGSIREFYEKLKNCDGAAKQAAETMQDTTKGAFTRFSSAVEAVAKNIGNAFLPMVRQAAEATAVYTQRFAEWIEEHQDIAKAAGIAAAAIAGLIMTALTVNVAVSGWRLLGSTIGMVANSSGALAGQLRIVTAAQAALNAVMAMHPFVLIAASIIGLMVLLAYLTGNMDKLKETASITFSHIAGTAGAMVAVLSQRFDEALAKITATWNSITGQSMKSAELIGAFFNNLGFAIGAAFDIASGVVMLNISVILNLLSSMVQVIGGVINIVVGLFTGDWERAWSGAGQAVNGLYSATAGTFKTITSGIGSMFDTLMGKADEVQKKAEQVKSVASVADIANTSIAGINQQAASEAQQIASSTAEASANTQEFALNMAQSGTSAQQTMSYMEQLNAVMGQVPAQSQAAFSGFGEQAAAAAQAVNTNLQQIPTQTQDTFQKLPPIAQQGTDGIAQEWAQLATKCQPGGEAFVQAANQWGQQAYENIARWSDQMAQVVVDKLSNAWAQISAQFSAGLNVNVTTSGAGVAANAEGGIYKKGAFLTTFAEKSPEAAIPLNGSNRAVSLWQKAGEMLGLMQKGTSDAPASFDIPRPTDFIEMPSVMKMAEALPPEISTIAEVAFQPTEAQMLEAPIAYEPPSMGGEISINFNPQITIQGNADEGTVSQMGDMLARMKAELMREVRREFGGMMADHQHNQRRRSYAT